MSELPGNDSGVPVRYVMPSIYLAMSASTYMCIYNIVVCYVELHTCTQRDGNLT